MRLRHHSKAKAVEVRKWVKEQPESRWKEVELRDSTRGDLVAEILHQRVVVGQEKRGRALLASNCEARN
jgi:hypothetical protein